MLNIHIKEKFHCMKKGRIAGIIIMLCFLLGGCASDNDNTNVVQQEETVAGSALEGGVSGNGVEQTAKDAEKEEAAEKILWSSSSYMTAYRRFLEAYVEEKEFANRARAMLALIDDDTVPELLLIEDNGHPSGVKVYTYDQESVVELGEFGSFGSMQYVERGGMIFSGYSGMGEGYSGFFQMEEGEAKLLCEIRDYETIDGSSYTYEIDGVSATKEACDKKWEELYDAYEYKLIIYKDAFAIQELEIADLLVEARNALLLQKESSRLAEMVAEQSEVLDGYGVFLAEYTPQMMNNSAEGPAFSLIYLDGDDVPELVVIEGDAHACGGYVYTFEEGKVVPIGEEYGSGYGQYGGMSYWEKEGIVFGDYDQGGNIYYHVYQIEGSKDTLLQSYSARWVLPTEGKEEMHIFTVDGKEVSEEEYRAVCDKWDMTESKLIQYDDCRTLTEGDIRSVLTEELENLILTQEEVLKQNVLIAAGACESNILLWDYDDYDGDGNCEAFMIVGNILDVGDGIVYYNNELLWFAGADGHTLALDNRGLRAIDGKMEFRSRKYLFFYLDYNFTANISVIWTVRDGKPVEEGDLFQRGQVVYRGKNARNEFEIWVDAYDHVCEKDGFGEGDDMWTGHTWKPYFYHYDSGRDQIEKYEGEIISGEAFGELSGTNLIEEIEADGYTVGDIIRWDNDIVTINYEKYNDDFAEYIYENVIWDNKVKDFWQKDARGVTSWKNAGEGGSYRL